jgi:phosphoglycolate phosphatase
MLAGMKSAGLRMACVTNKEARHARRLLEVTRLNRYFDIVIGGDSLTEKKPHASVLLHVARLLGADPACSAHLGDSSIDVSAARNSGLAAWAVSYGYNAGVPISSARPDQIFSNLFDVAEFVLSRRPR